MELWAITPELAIAIGFLLLLLAASFLQRWPTAVYMLAVGVLAAGIVLTWRMSGWSSFPVFHGTYAVDRFALFFKLYAAAAAILTLFPFSEYLRRQKFRADAPALVIIATLGSAMLAGSLDLALVVLFFYLIAASTIILVALLKEDDRSNEAALKYFVYSAGATAVLLFGLSFIYGLGGTTSIEVAAQGRSFALPILGFGLAIVGFGFEMAAAPFHMWAPDVYEGAPTPISGFISVLPKAAMIAVTLRIVTGVLAPAESAWRPMIEIMAVLSMTAGNIWALRQNNLKRLLAYSSIAQIGYILIGVAVSRTAEGGQSALFYLLTYLFMNLGAFFVVARLEKSLGGAEIKLYHGLFRRNPAVAVAFALLLLSLAGVPPLGGYLGKVLVLMAAIHAHAGWLAVVASANFVLAMYYYLRVIAAMFLHDAIDAKPIGASPMSDLPIALTVLASLVLGIFPAQFVAWVQSSWAHL